MSRKGGLRVDQHGGPQPNQRGNDVLVSNGNLILNVVEKRVVLTDPNAVGSVNVIQDGDSVSVVCRSSHDDMSELASDSNTDNDVDDDDDEDDEEDLGTFETTVAGGNETGWMTVKMGSKDGALGSLFTTEPGVESLPDLGDKGELFGPDDNSDEHDSAVNMCTDPTVLSTGPALARILDSDHKNATHSSPCSPAHQPFEGATLGRSRSYSDSGDRGPHSGLSSQDRACLEEIEKGSQLSPEEREMFENSRKELQALEFQSMSEDRSNTLMTPQELESMPERGLEFEASVGPKHDLTNRTVMPIVGDMVDLDNLVAEGLISYSDNMTSPAVIGTSTSTTNQSTVLTNSNNSNGATGEDVLASLAQNSVTDKSDGDSSSVSFTSDKLANSTHILINTPQGQQLLQINTSDLAKATSGGQTLTFQGGMIGLNTDGQVVNSGAVTGITVQDGYLVIPEGTVLLGTSNVDSSNQYENENQKQSPPGGKLWPCEEPGCDKVFSKLCKLKIHMMRHTGDRPFKCSVPGCGWAFTTGYKLKRHEESHEKKKDFYCNFEGCGRRFTTIYNLNTHRKLHDRPNTHACPTCCEKFPTMRKLDLHMKTHSDAQKTYKCPIPGCDKMFFSPHCMGSHTRVHQQDRERDLTCKFEGCGKVFDKFCRLKQHMRSHTGEKPYICGVEGCGWAFSTASKLKRHQRKHTGERRWVCPEVGCGKAFMRPEHLKGHMVTHSGEKPFACPVPGCGLRFTAKSSMYVHIKKHNQTDKKIVYFCPLDGCDKKYNNKTTLRSHIAKHYQAVTQAVIPINNDFGLVPLISPEDLQESLEGLVSSQADASTSTPADVTVTASGSIMAPDGTIINLSPSDLINTGEQSVLQGAAAPPGVPEATSPTGGNSMVTQLIVTNELAQAQQTLAAITAADTATTSPTKDMPKITIAADLDPDIMMQDDTSGSARTDYHSNHMLSDRARKRRKLLKDKTNGLDLPDLDLNVSESSLDTLMPATSKVSQTSTFNGDDLLTSRGITFRDPETGAVYVQTQLLQDDPPHPDLYGHDSASLDTADQSGLSSDISMSMLHDTDANDAVDNAAGAEFTGTTINLQDLA